MTLTNLNGISSMKLHRELATTQIGALHMLPGIRQVFRNSEAILAGTVEIDEIFIGRKERNKLESKGLKADRGTVGKIAVIGAKERGGRVAAKPIPATEAKTLGGFVSEMVEPGSSEHIRGFVGVQLRCGQSQCRGVRPGLDSRKQHRGILVAVQARLLRHLSRNDSQAPPSVLDRAGRAGIRNIDILDQTTHKARPIDGKMLGTRD